MLQVVPSSPFAIPNIRLFILFRVLFNARFYYPVFSILFLDFGLTLAQFAVLNAVWAATIVLCEVPSGALADTIGRRNLLVFAGLMMVIEITLWAFVPRDNLQLLFWVFVLNRILSGMAEAAASGADEALAYDSLKQEGKIEDWGHVLERQIQFQSAGFVIAMTLGGVLYDPNLMQIVTDFLGMEWSISQETTLRVPIYLTLITALLTLWTTLMMKEPGDHMAAEKSDSVSKTFRLTFRAGRWIFQTPFVLCVILAGLLFDSVVRMILTMASQYYRLIDIPESLFGILGSALALFGIIIPRIARGMSEHRTPAFNLAVVAAIALSGMVGMCFFWPVWGLLPALLLFSTMYFIGFFVSHYLNRSTTSDQRATVLSFKGLFFNLGYGLIGIMYSILLAFLRGRTEQFQPELTGDSIKNQVFIDAMIWFPGYFALALAGLLGFSLWALRNSKEPHQTKGDTEKIA
ncbi:MAG TPA: MFS transporter [Geopsychrobacteraceae bacterium]|nr:MFS transporter [Geopsychrobacteraceae bacterium]